MSLLSDLNNRIKALSTRIGTEVKNLWGGVSTAQTVADTANSTANTALTTANTKVSKSGDTMTGALSSDVDAFIRVVRAAGNTYAATAERTDSGNKVLFGIGLGGVNRGIFDNATNQWLVYYDANGYFSTGSARLKFGNGTQIWIA